MKMKKIASLVAFGLISTAMMASAASLPEGWLRLDYIEATGSQYINTGYCIGSGDIIDAEFEINPVQTNTRVGLFGATRSGANLSTPARMIMLKWDAHMGLGYGYCAPDGQTFDNGVGTSFVLTDNSAQTFGRRITLNSNKKNLTWAAQDGSGASGTISTAQSESFTAANPLAIFDIATYEVGNTPTLSRWGGDWGKARARLYSFKISNARKTILREYLPCVCTNGVIGLWETVEGKFFTSEVGSPLIGFGSPCARLPAGYTRLDYIQSTGTQFINTGHQHTSTTRVETVVQEVTQKSGDYGAVFGARQGDYRNQAMVFFSHFGSAQKPCYNRTGVETCPGDAFPNNRKVRLVCEGAAATWTCVSDPTQTGSITTTGAVDDGANYLYVFGNNTGTVYNNWSTDPETFVDAECMNLYSFKIYEGETLVSDLVPCRAPDGVTVGLFDLQRGTFLRNFGGSDNFYGSDNVWCYSSLTFPGTQGIDTGFNPNGRTAPFAKLWVAGSDDAGEEAVLLESLPGTVTIQDETLGSLVEGTSSVRVTGGTDGYTFRRLWLGDGETVERDLLPYRDAIGRLGLADARSDLHFYAPSGTGDFTWGGIAYRIVGTTNLVHEGTMSNDDLTLSTMPAACIEKVGAETMLDASAVTVPFPALTLSAGTLSFVDGEAAPVTVTNALTLTGGTMLAIDACLDGDGSVDCLTVGGCVLNATAQNPVVLRISPVGSTVRIGPTPLTVIAGGALAAGDEAKFQLEGVNGDLAVVEGALVLRRKPVPTVATATWTNGSGDRMWDNPANWSPQGLPTDVAVFGGAASGSSINASPFYIGSVAQAVDAERSCTHGGEGVLFISQSVTNDSSMLMLFTAPLQLGLRGEPFTVAANGGDIAFGGDVEVVASTLDKVGPGTLTVGDALLASAPAIDVREGAVAVNSSGDSRTVTGALTVAAGAQVSFPVGDTTFAGSVANAGTVSMGTGETRFEGMVSGGGTFSVPGGSVWIDVPGGIPHLGSPFDAAVTLAYDRTCSANGFASSSALLRDAGRPLAVLGSVPPSEGAIAFSGETWTLGTLKLGDATQYGALTVGDGATLAVSEAIELGATADSRDTALTVGAGGTLTFSGAETNFLVGCCGRTVQPGATAHSTFTVDGGTVDTGDTSIWLAPYQPHADLMLNAGTLTTKGVQFYLGPDINRVNPDASFAQTGGTLNLGADGFKLNAFKWETEYEPWCMTRNAKPFANLVNGVLTATASFSTSVGGFTAVFGSASDAGGRYTIDLNGHDISWNTALAGMSDVTLQGNGSFTSVKEFKGILSGKWTVNASADLSGAAGFEGGLVLGENVNAVIDIGTPGTVEMLHQGVDEYISCCDIFSYAGPYPYVVNSMDRLHLPTPALSFFWNNFLYRGEFYVPEDATYYFGANFKGNPYHFGGNSSFFSIDGHEVLKTRADGNSVVSKSVVLTTGWHSFFIVVFIDAEEDGPAWSDWKEAQMGLGWTTTNPGGNVSSASSYQKFDPSTIRMRAGSSRAGLGGVIDLGAGATLENRATGACPIHGEVKGAGSLSGVFRFTDEGRLDVAVTSEGRVVTPNLNAVRGGDLFVDLRTVNLTLAARTLQMYVDLGPAGDLTSAQAAEIAINVTKPDGLKVGVWRAALKDGRLVLVNPNPAGFTLRVR